MNTQISMMINEYIEKDDFFGAVPDEDISRAEEKLGYKFPRQYKEFVKAYAQEEYVELRS